MGECERLEDKDEIMMVVERDSERCKVRQGQRRQVAINAKADVDAAFFSCDTN